MAKNKTKQAASQVEPLPFHPLADIFPLLEGAEFDAFVADIKAHGLHEPITVFEDKVLEGRNRQRACIAAGVEPRYRPFQGDDPVAYVISANIHRRHLSPDQKRDLIAKLVKAQPEKSDRQIAEATKASPTTVGTVRAKLEAEGDVSKLDTRTDSRGRKQPAKKAKRRDADDLCRDLDARKAAAAGAGNGAGEPTAAEAEADRFMDILADAGAEPTTEPELDDGAEPASISAVAAAVSGSSTRKGKGAPGPEHDLWRALWKRRHGTVAVFDRNYDDPNGYVLKWQRRVSAEAAAADHAEVDAAGLYPVAKVQAHIDRTRKINRLPDSMKWFLDEARDCSRKIVAAVVDQAVTEDAATEAEEEAEAAAHGDDRAAYFDFSSDDYKTQFDTLIDHHAELVKFTALLGEELERAKPRIKPAPAVTKVAAKSAATEAAS